MCVCIDVRSTHNSSVGLAVLILVMVSEPELLLYVELVLLGIAMVLVLVSAPQLLLYVELVLLENTLVLAAVFVVCCFVVWSNDIVLFFQCNNKLIKIIFQITYH